MGITVWTLGAAAWLMLWAVDPSEAIAAGATLIGFLAAGKIVGITAGLTLDGNPVTVWFAVFLPDFGAVVFFHPLSEFGINRLGKWSRFIGNALETAKARHARGEGFIAEHGAWGIFLLSLVPVGFYSPLVIAALGQVAGLRPGPIIAAVGGAMAIMTTVWVAGLNAGLDRAALIDPRLPWIIGIGLTLIIVGKGVITAIWRIKHPLPKPAQINKPPSTGEVQAVPPEGP